MYFVRTCVNSGPGRFKTYVNCGVASREQILPGGHDLWFTWRDFTRQIDGYYWLEKRIELSAATSYCSEIECNEKDHRSPLKICLTWFCTTHQRSFWTRGAKRVDYDRTPLALQKQPFLIYTLSSWFQILFFFFLLFFNF